MALKTQLRTPAETALIERAESGLAVADAQRQAALETLRREGLPSRRVEAWHYTDLRALLGRRPTEAGEAAGISYLAPLIAGSAVVELGTDAGKAVNHLDRGFDTVRLLNIALGSTGSQIKIADGTKLATPIELRATPRPDGSHSFASVTLGAGSNAVVVERLSAGSVSALSSAVSELVLGDDTEVLWIIDQAKGAGETHLGQLNVTLGANAQFRMFILNAGGAVVRMEVHAETKGEGSDIMIRGVNLLAEGQHIDVTTTLNHLVANTTSTEIFRNVVTGGHGVFLVRRRPMHGVPATRCCSPTTATSRRSPSWRFSPTTCSAGTARQPARSTATTCST